MDNYLERHHAELVARNNMLNSLYHQTPAELLGVKIPSKLPPADPFDESLKTIEKGVVARETDAWEEEAMEYERLVRSRNKKKDANTEVQREN